MSLRSKVLTSIAAGAFLAVGTAASSFANPNPYNGSPSTYTGNNSSNDGLSNTLHRNSFINQGRLRLPRASETASHYYRVGVTNFEKGNLKKAEKAFNAVLRADGLDEQAHYYLARVKLEQGDREGAAWHALVVATFKDYYEIVGR